jgi:ABC-type transport system involved in multi-copper enzyme maturation permease subunit
VSAPGLFGAVCRFEVRYHLQRPLTWGFFAILLAQGFLFTGTDAVVLAGGGLGRVARNAPWAVAGAMLMGAVISQVFVTAIIGIAVLRDYQARAHELLFTTPISKGDYLLGRFTGALVVMLVVHTGIPLGQLLGAMAPWVDPRQLQPLSLAPYAVQFATLVVPTVVLTSALFFAVGAFTRSLLAVYTQGMVLLVAWSATRASLASIDNQRLAALLDPFGVQAYEVRTRYWSAAEKSSRMVPLDGVMLENRLLWLAVAAAIMTATVVAVRFRSAPALGARRGSALAGGPARVARPAGAAPRRHDAVAWRRQVLSTARLTFLGVVRSVPFLVIALAGMLTLVRASAAVDTLYGDITWPLSYTVAEGMAGGFQLFFALLITIYAGEAIWRERQLKLDQVVDALPTRPGVALLGNFAGLAMVELALLGGLLATGIAIQLAKGYPTIDWGVYLGQLLGVTYPGLLQLTALAFLVHVVINQKFVGHAVMLLAVLVRLAGPALGIEHRLLTYGASPAFRYSDLNGFGPYVPELALSALYGSGVALLLLVVAHLLGTRGTDASWTQRGRVARERWGRGAGGAALAGVVLTVGAGGATYWQTNVRHAYRTTADRRAGQVRYERTYGSLSTLRLPRLVGVEIEADLEPERLAFAVGGTFTYVNTHDRPVDSVVVTLWHRDVLVVDTLRWDRGATTLVDAPDASTRIDRFDQPLQPGDTVRLAYRARYLPRGFSNEGPVTAITANGTFLRTDWFPTLGVRDELLLADPEARRQAGLPPRDGMRRQDDRLALDHAYYLGRNADWVRFRARVRTAPDQVAIAPGTLVRDTVEGGRRVFEYVMERPMANEFAVLSARYAVRRVMHRGRALEVYHHPAHTFNVDRMVAGMQRALDRYEARFGPYQFQQVRIVEFPRYAQYALSMPGLIPFSESAGFILRRGAGDDDLDLPFYVTAHEVGHMWWGQQVAGADVQGVRWINEGLANYSAMGVMEEALGRAALRRFLAWELDRYLYGRSQETGREHPLATVENQPYVHYHKGSLALHALREAIGADAMDSALRRFVAERGNRGPPFPTSRDLLGYLAAATPDSLRGLLTDLFETVTLWDLRTASAVATRQADGRYAVRIEVAARKARVDSLGTERDVPMDDVVDIGVFTGTPEALGKPLLRRRMRLRGDTAFTVVVDAPPGAAGIDPDLVLIDRQRGDNVVAVRIGRR